MTLAIKTLGTAVALVTLIAGTPVLAQSPRQNDQQVTRDTNDVMMRGKVIGRDPDPFIRSQIERGYTMGGSQD
ncbi:MAG TPA: hypothetical protein VFP43_07520 [Mesorhizobium sp.]|jgi:hypothetical protein|nr:hypothetical protein [Mesorhizobium sp.]